MPEHADIPEHAEPFHPGVAIVTGAAHRIGRALALTLAARGCDLVLHYGRSVAAAREVADDIEALGRRTVLVQADLRQPCQAARRIVAAAEPLGGATILVNNAGIFEDAPPGQTSEDLFDRHLDINLKAPFFLCQEFASHLPDRQQGRILNIVDWRAARPTSDHIAYTLSKAGLAALTRGLALQMAPRIRVNGIAPGAILPPTGGDLPAWRAAKSRDIPLDRLGAPDDLCAAAVYLLGAPFVTGEILHVTGGEQLR